MSYIFLLIGKRSKVAEEVFISKRGTSYVSCCAE